jgi:hypothetical protein
MQSNLDAFIECLNEERFYDAHEVLEEVWFPRRFEDTNEVKLLKGFINAAVSFELYKLGRYKQSQKVWLNYLKYRQLLFKVDSLMLNKYYIITRHIEVINTKNTRRINN